MLARQSRVFTAADLYHPERTLSRYLAKRASWRSSAATLYRSRLTCHTKVACGIISCPSRYRVVFLTECEMSPGPAGKNPLLFACERHGHSVATSYERQYFLLHWAVILHNGIGAESCWRTARCRTVPWLNGLLSTSSDYAARTTSVRLRRIERPIPSTSCLFVREITLDIILDPRHQMTIVTRSDRDHSPKASPLNKGVELSYISCLLCWSRY